MTRSNHTERFPSAAAAVDGRSGVRGPLAITHVTAITMQSPRPLADHTVIIEDGLIRAMAPSGELDVTGMRCIDGTNRYLMPGLSDMHTHITDAGVCALYLANGVTQLRNMDGRPWHLALSRRIERGELLGPRIVSVSPLIDGLGAEGLTARPRSLVVMEPAEAPPLVRQLVERGYREIKAYQWLSLDVLRSLGSSAARAGVRMAGHCPDGITFEESIAAGMSCFEHLTGIATGHLRDGRQIASMRDAASRRNTRESLELIAHHLDFDAIRRLAGMMAAKQIWNCPTLVVWQKQIQPPQLAAADPDLQYEHPSVVREWERLIEARFTTLPCPAVEWLALGRARDEALAKVVSILHEEGAPLLLGTDAPNPFVIHGCSIHHELANLVRAGLSPYEALRCGTTEAARFCGETAIRGSVSAGQRADLLLLRANPLVDVTAVRDDLEAVFVNGRCLTRANLDGLLEGHSNTLAAPPATHLPQLNGAGNAQIERRGSFQEWLGDAQVGRADYTHGRLTDGGWQVEEHAARSGPRGPQQCTTRLWLGADFTVRRAEVEIDTDVGHERNEISWVEGAYRIRITQPDGHTSNSQMSSLPLLPSERLAFSVLPAWLRSRTAPVAASSLSIEHEAAHVARVTAEPSPADVTRADGANGAAWRVTVAHPGELAVQTIRIADDGALLWLRDVLFDTRREFISEPAADPGMSRPRNAR